jgi:hypothetical protein
MSLPSGGPIERSRRKTRRKNNEKKREKETEKQIQTSRISGVG